MNMSDELQKLFIDNPFLPLNDAVYEILYNKIVNFDYLPDSRIIIADLSDELGVSRTPIQAAINRLSEEGLVYTRKSKGAYIAPFNTEEYENFYELRTALEIAAVRLTASKITTIQLRKLNEYRRLLTEAYTENNYHEIILGEDKFHNYIVSCCGNPYIIKAYEKIGRQIRRYRFYVAVDKASYTTKISQHNYIYSSLCQRDPDCCAAAMKSHLANAPVDYEKNYLEAIKRYSDIQQLKNKE